MDDIRHFDVKNVKVRVKQEETAVKQNALLYLNEVFRHRHKMTDFK